MRKIVAFGSVWLVLSAFGGGLPYAFEYGGKVYRGYEGVIDGTLKVSVERQEFPDFPGADWYTVWFENVGDKPTAVLKDIVSLDAVFAGEKPVLSGILGDHKNLYRPYAHDFAKDGAKEFVSLEGRATHVVFPYFNLTHGDGGTLLALGWAGTWKAEFTPVADGVRLVGRNSVGFESQLLPGEKVRSALVARIPYAGRDEQAAMNVWRRFYMRHVLPKNADGSDLKPLTAAGFAGDTGLPNSDGSISERSFTWQPTLQKLIDEKVVPDFRWFDAGWYCDPSGKTVPTRWWDTVGTWELDREKWPGNSFRESNEACHRAGMKVFMWFEPERVTHLDELTKNYGYKREWSVEGHVCTSDLGNPECFKWTLDRILKTMDDGAVDMYREDNNSDPAGAWKVFDQRTAETTGLVRTGISENKGIQGHYALWDGIIAHCKATGRCPYVDSCAAGGGRNDLESMRRGFPMLRSDFDRTTTALRLSMSWGFNKWIPFHGTATKETQGQLDVANQFADEYVSRASLLPVYAYHESFSRNKNLDFDILRRNLAEWRSVADLLTKDFYTLTPWRAPNDRTGWTVFVYRDPATKRGVLMAFRQEDCKEATCEVTLPFETDPAKRTLTLKLDQPRSSLLMELGTEDKPEKLESRCISVRNRA